MFEVEVKLKKWGSSVGALLPKDKLTEDNLKPGETVKIRVTKKVNVLRKTFGTVSFAKSTSKILSEIRKELWNE